MTIGHQRRWGRTITTFLAALSTSACIHRPVTAPVAIVPDLVRSEVRIAGAGSSRFGDMVAVGVGLRNGAANTYLVSGTRIYAIDRAGDRVAPLPVEEAVRQAGGTTELVAGLQGAGGGAILGGLFGAVPGAILGAAHGGRSGSGTGAAIGAGLGLAVGALSGFYASKAETEREIAQQLEGLMLRDQALEPGMPISGFVFYPRNEYVEVRAIVVDQTTHDAVEIGGDIIDARS